MILVAVLCGIGFVAVGCAGDRQRSLARLWPAESKISSGRQMPFRAMLGHVVRSALRRPADPSLDQAVGTSVIVGAALGVINLGYALVGVVVVWVCSVAQRRRAVQRERDQVESALADAIDLVAMALVSGGNVRDAVRQVGAWAEGPIANAFEWCDRQAEAGRSLSDAIEQLPTMLGPHVRPLAAALVATERYGAPITASLGQLAADTRADRRRRAEASARRLPVLLLFPLVVCVLPAFLLITVVPVIFETVSNFDVSASP